MATREQNGYTLATEDTSSGEVTAGSVAGLLVEVIRAMFSERECYHFGCTTGYRAEYRDRPRKYVSEAEAQGKKNAVRATKTLRKGCKEKDANTNSKEVFDKYRPGKP